MDQARNDLLSWIYQLPVPAEFGAAEVSRRKMDEVGCTRFSRGSNSEVTFV